ncbi:hypothetical protein [Amycolatopsis sp. cmx-11-12]|uniref:hypothetical protein n=1 Tax=Amycolatopsis sp. cmx-11-12 TaxID=2785795 RepID=UPI0039173A0A
MTVVPDFVGQQALDAWLAGHEAGLSLQGPDPGARSRTFSKTPGKPITGRDRRRPGRSLP